MRFSELKILRQPGYSLYQVKQQIIFYSVILRSLEYWINSISACPYQQVDLKLFTIFHRVGRRQHVKVGKFIGKPQGKWIQACIRVHGQTETDQNQQQIGTAQSEQGQGQNTDYKYQNPGKLTQNRVWHRVMQRTLTLKK